MKIEISDPGTRTLREILLEKEIYVDSPCGGAKTCGKCAVKFQSGAPEPTAEERILLTKEQLAEGIRLACCTVPTADCAIDCSGVGTDAMEVETGFYRKEAEASKPDRKAKSGSEAYGVAVDLGTTTIAMELIRLSDGALLQTGTMVNHQRMYGADVISRIQASNEGKAQVLKQIVWKDLASGIDRLLAGEKRKGGRVETIVIAGNTTMCHLLLGYSCETLGAAPFTPVDLSLTSVPWMFPAANPGLSKANIVVLPGISAFVGADIVAGILSTGMDESSGITMLIDMGTNSEMVIGNRDRFLVTSAAAGPAFEGGNISCGMAGVPGAVSHVSIAKNGAEVFCETIGGQKAAGICGSGIVDVISELVRTGMVDENGTLCEPFFTDGFPLTEQVRITQEDIREIQMAKSAIRAGIETLVKEYGVAYEEVDTLYLAGGFGRKMNVASAAGIGLLPPELADRVVPVGNSALEGARRYLEKDSRERIARIRAAAKEVNLAMHPEFNERYLQYMFF